MRLPGLILLTVLVVGGVGIFGFNAFGLRTKIFSKAKEGAEAAQGFGSAKNPVEAMDLFRKAIQERRFSTAAKYVVGSYGQQLALVHDAASSIGEVLDEVKAYTENKGFKTDKTLYMLQLFDPFPKNFAVRGAPQTTGNSTLGVYVYETLTFKDPNAMTQVQAEMNNVDQRMFLNNVHPYGTTRETGLGFLVELVSEGTGDAKTWKLKIEVPNERVQAMGCFKDHHRAYLTGLQKFVQESNNQRYGSKLEYERELIRVFVDAK